MALVSGLMKGYRSLCESAFNEFLLGYRFVSPFPNTDRYRQFLTRIKERNPEIMDLAICKDGLPNQWLYIQMTRSALTYNGEEHEFRQQRVRNNNPRNTEFEQYNFGFGTVNFSFAAYCNNDSAAEMCEELFYRRLYKIKLIPHIYLDLNFETRCDHSSITDFSLTKLDGDQDSGWTLQWIVEIKPYILMKDIEGKVVDTVTTIVYDRTDLELPLTLESGVPGPLPGFTLPAPVDTPQLSFTFTAEDIPDE